MADAVINIVNRALGRASLTPLQPSDYDSSFERNPNWLRNVFPNLYSKLANLQQDDFRAFFDVTTTSGVNSYTIAPSIIKFENDCMWLIDAGDGDLPIYYHTEAEILRQYNGDLSGIEPGQPYGFFIRTTALGADKKLSFVLAPDDTYTIRGYYYQDATALTGTSLTACSSAGDLVLEDQLYAFLMFNTGKLSKEEADTFSRDSELRYACLDFKGNTRKAYSGPFQHDTNGSGISYTRNGTVFV
jgi:hypothetical protein